MDLLGCGACQLVQAHVSIPPRKCVCLQPVPSRGDCSGSLKQMVSPKAPSWGQWALSSEFLAAIWPSWPRSDRGKCWEPNIARAEPHVGRQSLLAKVGPAALHLKANKEPRLMEKKVCFLLQASNLVGRANSRPKADFPYLTLPPTVSRKEIL